VKFLRLTSTNRVLILICVTYAFVYIDRANMGIAAPAIRKEFNLSNTEMGLVFSAFSYSYFALAWIGGWFADRFGPRMTLFICGTVFSIATILTGLSVGLTFLIATRLLLGFAEAPCLATGTRAMGNWVPKARWGFAQGLAQSATRGATALTPIIMAVTIAGTSWRGSFLIVGLVGLAWMFVWLWLFRDNPSQDSNVSSEELKTLVPVETKVRNIPYFRLFRRFFPLFLSFFCHGWTLWAYLSWLPSFFLQTYHVDLKTSALFTSGILTAGIAGNLAGGIISDWIFKRTGNTVAARTYVIVAAFLMAAVCLTPVLFSTDMFTVTMALTLAFFFTEVSIPPLWLVPLDVSPQYSGTGGSILTFGFGLSGILSPMTFGLLIDLTHDWHIAFATSIGFLLVGAVVAFWLHPERPFQYVPAERKEVPVAA
jgi:sugar phosphate permease